MHDKHLELADIIREYGKKFRKNRSLTRKQKAVLTLIELCRTEQMGCHLDACSNCDHTETSYNSCRDRHCPKCQGIAQRRWVKKQQRHLLPVSYYHAVFTLPAGLFPFSLYNKRLIYGLLFDCAAATLKEFGKDPRWLGGKIGFYGILHTWGQKLWLHPHVHFIVAGGALDSEKGWIAPRHGGKFLFPVRAMSKVFRGKFMRALELAIGKGDFTVPEGQQVAWDPERFLRSLVRKDWVVYCKPPFSTSEEVVSYIGRYTHRVALSNNRLQGLKDGAVRFSFKDYRDGSKTKVMNLDVYDFLQRFLWHVLPEGFHRIRHYGFLANGTAHNACVTIRAMLTTEPERKTEPPGLQGRRCSNCRKGTMIPQLILTATGFLVRPRQVWVAGCG